MPSISLFTRLSAAWQTGRARALAAAIFLLASAARADEPIVLQLKWYHQFQFAGYYAAEAKGFYRGGGPDTWRFARVRPAARLARRGAGRPGRIWRHG